MMLQYDRFYYLYGSWKNSHFIKPKVLSGDTFIFPKESELYWFKVSDVIEPMTKEYGYLKRNKSIVVKTVLEYSEDGNLGSYRNAAIVAPAIIKTLSSKERRIRFLRPGASLRLNKTQLFAYNYGAITYRYRYPSNPLNRLFKFHNCLNKVVEDINNVDTLTSDRAKFITIDLPDELPRRERLDIYSNNMTSTYLKKLPNYKYLTIIELWKLLTPELKSRSIFSKIKPELYDKVNFMLISNNKIVLLNMKILLGLVKDYDVESKLNKLKDITVRKLIYLKLYKLITGGVMSSVDNDAEEDIDIDDVDTSVKKNINLSETNEDIKNNKKVVIDDIIEHDVIEKDIELEYEDEEDSEEEEEIEVTGFELTNTMNDLDNTIYSTIKDLEHDNKHYDSVVKKLHKLKEDKVITKREADIAEVILTEQKDLTVEYLDNRPLQEILDDSKDDISLNEEDVSITSSNIVLDDRYNKDVIGAMGKKYIREQYKKDIVRTVYSFQNSASIVEDYKTVKEDSVLGGIEKHNIKIRTLNGMPANISVVLPKIEEDGTFMLSGNRYTMRKQRSDLPIRKIGATQVALSSYYGKLFIEKASTKKDDAGYWFKNKIASLYESDPKLKNLVLMSVDNKDAVLPKLYSLISRYVSSFNYNKYQFIFSYKKRVSLVSSDKVKDFNKLEKNNMILVGSYKGNLIGMDFSDRLFIENGNGYKELPSIYDMLGIDRNNQPIEHVSMRVFSNKIPIVFILSYYIGLEQLMRLINAKYRFVKETNRVPIESDEYKITFKDGTLIIKRDFDICDLILSGLLIVQAKRNKSEQIKNIKYSTFNNKSLYGTIFNSLDLAIIHINEIKMLEELFVDHITLGILKKLELPTSFKGLLLKAVELLVDDNYKNPNNLTEMTIKGYERISGLMYKQIVNSIKEHENRTFFSKSKINIKPYELLNKINEDSTVMLVDDLNPVAALKQQEDVTYLGFGGRSKDGMSKKTRVYHESELGIISEAGKDSGDVGISAYMSASPKLDDIRGSVGEFDIEKDGWVSALSTSAMLAPFALTDDPKRLMFSGIQNSHVIPIKGSRAPYVQTGYESIVAIRSDDRFVISAKDSGVVDKVNSKELVVVYDKLGTKKYKINNWTSKEESEACYTHIMTANLKAGDKFIKDDTLIYNTSFFEPSIFNNKRVIYKQGAVITVALHEISNTHEDSGIISKEMSKVLATTVTKTKSVLINKEDTVINLKQVKDKLEPGDTLFSITDSILGNTKLDARTIEILQDLKTSSPKSKYRGTVNKIEVRYNCEIEELSQSLRELVNITDKELKDKLGHTGRVNSSYSIKGKPLMDGEVEIKYYIDIEDKMGNGDKGIFANQLKFTVGEVFTHKISTEDNTKVDAMFSLRSIAARIVNSPYLIGTTSMVMEKLTENVLDIYFGEDAG